MNKQTHIALHTLITSTLWQIQEPKCRGFNNVFPSGAADSEIGSCNVGRDPDTKACSQAQQKAVSGLTGGGRLGTGFLLKPMNKGGQFLKKPCFCVGGGAYILSAELIRWIGNRNEFLRWSFER